MQTPLSSIKRQTSSNKILRADKNGTLAVPGNFPGDLYELEEKKSKVNDGEKSKQNDKWNSVCKVCGQEGRQGQEYKRPH